MESEASFCITNASIFAAELILACTRSKALWVLFTVSDSLRGV